MKIIVLRSSFQNDEFVKKEYAELIEQLKNECQAEITIVGDESRPDTQDPAWAAPDAVMVATGGVENLFVKTTPWQSMQKVTLIADGRNNSWPASLEILTFLEGKGVKGRPLHGSNTEIIQGLLGTAPTPVPTVAALLRGTRIGLFGPPSDWLIASDVDRDYLRESLGVETLDIDLQRVVDGIKAVPQAEAVKVSQRVVKRASGIVEPSCSDMVEAAKTYLDLQTLMSMLLAKRLCGEEAFMANPSILTDDTTMFAHCTIPLKMCDGLSLRSHFESSQGVAIQGVMPKRYYTIFKWGGRRLDRWFVAEAEAVETPYSEHFCRTQLTLKINMKPYLLNHPIGNHHVIIPGKHEEEVRGER